jgi:predicted nucleic acid-binding protein
LPDFAAMSAERPLYVDSSALVKLAVAEPESKALRQYLRRNRPHVTSALARTEVARALLPLGAEAVDRGASVLQRVELIRVSDRVLRRAGELEPIELRSLDAIHLATAQLLEPGLRAIVTYDARMADAARAMKIQVRAPA